ncbi:hypothetical protein [Tardiphaga sp.]|jgi:hypothetical protein|uniref:hypothetical protein n=1 Tax=Tardiphaga sp. TaxID=1926292 RepID=UPI0037D9C764
MADLFYICDMRKEWLRKPYITFWRPSNAGYAYPLSWAGKYDLDEMAAAARYYWIKNTRGLVRFPILCRVAELYGVPPGPGMVDGDAGPVIPNTKQLRATLRAAAMKHPTFALTGKDRTDGAA